MPSQNNPNSKSWIIIQFKGDIVLLMTLNKSAATVHIFNSLVQAGQSADFNDSKTYCTCPSSICFGIHLSINKVFLVVSLDVQ